MKGKWEGETKEKGQYKGLEISRVLDSHTEAHEKKKKSPRQIFFKLFLFFSDVLHRETTAWRMMDNSFCIHIPSKICIIHVSFV